MIGRYEVVRELGRSDIGAVYVADDRLTGSRVAMRTVTAPLLDAGGDGRTEGRDGASEEPRLRLAELLRRVASLHHPHLVALLDYGFDDAGRPFYTQRLLADPVGVLAAGRGRPLATRVDFLLQTLQGLIYLHRHGVVHGDLRPKTVLIEDGEVRLVNFGLSALRQPARGAAAAYLAPEVRRGGAASARADLYAVGVLIFELLSGQPIGREESASASGLRGPEISTRDVDARWIPVLEKLLAGDPADRYADAAGVIRDLAAALGRPLPEETAAIRDSFLERARFVDRRRALERLGALLTEALAGRGGALVIAGESGVGRTRLLEELRTLSLARGAQVLLGRAVSEGFDPYHAWRGILRHLCLLADVDDEAAAVLLQHVPDVGELVGREVAAAPALDPEAARRRFTDVVLRLFASLRLPVVVLLEDLHWAGSESLALLQELQQSAPRLPLLLIGTYREDERPDLQMVLSETPQLRLQRLDRAATGELAESMLGLPGRRPELVDFLHRETGGNAFFLVEVVRVLAEDAGRLEEIDPSNLPRQVTSGGIERVLKRRLDRLPQRVRPLLQLAAVAGRDVDLKLLETLQPEVQMRLWLRFCADQAVLELDRGRWRFANDRFREAVLADLPAAELRALYRRVAEAVAATHGEGEDQVAALARLWSRAADLSDPEATAMAADYLERAGAAAVASCAHREAEALLGRGLELLSTLSPPRPRQEIRLQISLGGIYLMSRGYTAPAVGRAFGRARSLCDETGDTTELAAALLGLWHFHIVRAELETARRLAEEMLEHAEAGGQARRRMLAEYAIGNTILFQGEPETAAKHLRIAIDLYTRLRAAGRREIAAAAFYCGQNPGVASYIDAACANWLLGYPEHALALSRRALALAEELQHPFSLAFTRVLQATLDHMRGEPEATAAAARAAAELCEDKGFPGLLWVSRVYLGWARARTGEAAAGIAEIREALDGLRTAASELFRPTYQALLAEAYGAAARPAEGLAVLEQAIADAERRGSGYWLPELHRLRGELYLQLPRPNRRRAEDCFRQARDDARRRRERALELRALTSLARLRQGDGERLAATLAELDKLVQGFSEGHETPDLIAARRLLPP